MHVCIYVCIYMVGWGVGGGGLGVGVVVCCHYGVPLKWVTFGVPRVPTYVYSFGKMFLEIGHVFHYHPQNWGSNSVFLATMITRAT